MNKRRRAIALLAPILALAGWCVWFFAIRVPPVTAEFLQGEWVQDPEFLQNAGQDLDALKLETDHWENYEFAFRGNQLTGWRYVFDDGAKNMAGWAEGKGAAFQSEFSLVPAGKATMLRFNDHAKAPVEASLVREGVKLAVTIGPRRLRLQKARAVNLHARGLVP